MGIAAQVFAWGESGQNRDKGDEKESGAHIGLRQFVYDCLSPGSIFVAAAPGGPLHDRGTGCKKADAS